MFLKFLFLATGIILFLMIFFIIKKHINFFLSSRPSRFIYYSVIWSSGFFLGVEKHNYLSGFSLYINFFTGLLLINVLFLSSIILNNLYDINIDKFNRKLNPLLDVIDKKNYLKIFWLCFLSSLFLSISINFIVLLITLIIHLTAFIYSCPPLRIKKSFPFNIILIGFSSVLALFSGFASCGEFKIFLDFPYRTGIIILIALSLAFNVKDINDYKGDKKFKVKTIMTIFGYKRGKKIIAWLAFSGYLILPVLLNSSVLFFYGLIFGALTFFIILKSKYKINEAIIFMIFFIYLVFFIIHKPVLI